jgi:hypothetical protein
VSSGFDFVELALPWVGSVDIAGVDVSIADRAPGSDTKGQARKNLMTARSNSKGFRSSRVLGSKASLAVITQWAAETKGLLRWTSLTSSTTCVPNSDKLCKVSR